MNFNFVPMYEDYAKQLVESWNYEGIYACYSYKYEKEHIERTPDYNSKLQDATMWIGFQLRPDLTGKGIGSESVQACVDFVVEKNKILNIILRQPYE